MSFNAIFKSFSAAGAIAPKSFVKYTGNRNEVAQAAASTDVLAGICDLGATAAGDMVDVAQGEFFEVTCGAVAIAAGAPITSDASGLAITAAKVVGSTVFVAGFAQVAAAPGDIFRCLVAPSVIVG